jgi:transposase
MRKQRTTYTPEEKARIILEVLREDSTLNEVSNKYSVSPQLISRWKTEFLENMPAVFDKKATEVENMKKEHAAEKEALINQIGQLTVDVNWLKKKQQQASELTKRKR